MKSPNIAPRGIRTRNAVSKKELYVYTILLASASEESAKCVLWLYYFARGYEITVYLVLFTISRLI